MILGDGAVELLNVLFPHLAGIDVESVVASDRSVRLEAAVMGPRAACQVCGRPSGRVHRRYQRCLADRGVGGRDLMIRLRVRRKAGLADVSSTTPAAHRIAGGQGAMLAR